MVASDRAAIEAAQVALSYSRITAQSAGRAGAINVFAGSFVQPSGAALVTITQLDPIAVAFSLPQRNLGQALAAMRDGGGKVTATFPESGASASGKLLFVDNTVDVNSGTVRVKAEFANKDERLWPGAFVNIRLAVQTLKGASVVPQAAIIQSPRGKMVYVVDASGKAAPRPVEVLYAQGMDAAVSGVKPGERVVVDGRQNLRPGSSVIERAPADGTPRGKRGGPASAASGANSGASARRRRSHRRCLRPEGGASVMNLSELFIRRPVLTVLLNAAIVVAGVIAWRSIPIAALPSYNTPVINVFAQLPGASRRRWRARSPCSSRSSSRRFPAWR